MRVRKLDAGARGPLEPGDYRRELTHDAFPRSYELHIPPSCSSTAPVPVVLNFHGGFGGPAQQRYTSGMDDLSDREGFVVVYPAGTGLPGGRSLTFNAGICCGFARDLGVDDVGFVAALLDDLARLVPTIAPKAFVTGFSNGAFLCYRLAVELSDRIAAFAPVSGVLGVDIPDGRRVSPMPLLHIHGRLDEHVTFQGGVGPRAFEKTQRRSVADSIAPWLAANGCGEPKVTREGPATETVYGGGVAPVTVLVAEDGAHTWPGGLALVPEELVGPTSEAFSATDRIWKFFRQFVG